MNDVWLASGSVNIFIDTVKQINNKISENVFSNDLFCSGFGFCLISLRCSEHISNRKDDQTIWHGALR